MAISASSLHFGHLIFILSNTVHELLLLYIKQVDKSLLFSDLESRLSGILILIDMLDFLIILTLNGISQFMVNFDEIKIKKRLNYSHFFVISLTLS